MNNDIENAAKIVIHVMHRLDAITVAIAKGDLSVATLQVYAQELEVFDASIKAFGEAINQRKVS